MKKLEGKAVLVTGGSRGIGEAIVQAVAAEGASVGVNYARSGERARRICRDLQNKYTVRAIPLKADVSRPQQVARMVETMLEEFGKIDALVNNAGILVQAKLVETSLDDWNAMIATDLTGVFLCTKAVLPHMLKRHEGRIVNIASQLGQIGANELVAYSAAKGGVIAFTKALAREVTKEGILVNCVAPGPIDTDMVSGLTPRWKKVKQDSLPLGRFGKASEVAPSVVFLLSADSNIFAGQTLGPNSGDVML